MLYRLLALYVCIVWNQSIHEMTRYFIGLPILVVKVFINWINSTSPTSNNLFLIHVFSMFSIVCRKFLKFGFAGSYTITSTTCTCAKMNTVFELWGKKIEIVNRSLSRIKNYDGFLDRFVLIYVMSWLGTLIMKKNHSGINLQFFYLEFSERYNCTSIGKTLSRAIKRTCSISQLVTCTRIENLVVNWFPFSDSGENVWVFSSPPCKVSLLKFCGSEEEPIDSGLHSTARFLDRIDPSPDDFANVSDGPDELSFYSSV